MARKTAEIKCINTDGQLNPYERVTHIAWYVTGQWKITQQAAIRFIEAGEWDFFVIIAGRRVLVEVATNRFGRKYLKTQVDKDEPTNLLNLPECV
ncbi:MAG: DUF3892 domain-containing protein [Hyphomicrobiaceae bacterium]